MIKSQSGSLVGKLSPHVSEKNKMPVCTENQSQTKCKNEETKIWMVQNYELQSMCRLQVRSHEKMHQYQIVLKTSADDFLKILFMTCKMFLTVHNNKSSNQNRLSNDIFLCKYDPKN